MKRNILIAFVLLFFSMGALSAVPQTVEKSEVEKFIREASRIKSKEIDYAYISTNMFKQVFGMIDGNVSINGIGGLMAGIKSLRSFVTTGSEGYRLLSRVLQPFLQGDDTVMGMELMALNREDGMLSVIYSDKKNLLVVNDEGNEMSVVFIVGLSYDSFIKMTESGIKLGF